MKGPRGVFADMSEAPDKPTSRWSTRIIVVLLAAVALPVGASIMYAFPPTDYGFYPKCWFHWLTGLHCPGCGATRCVYALLRGDLAQALAYNPVFVLVLPFIAYSGGCTAYSSWTGKSVRIPNLPGWAAIVIAILMGIYWIARNIDIYPLTLLAPHEI